VNDVYKLGEKYTVKELIEESGLPFTEEDMKDRLSGKHCECEEGQSMFVLLPKEHPAVKEGGKRYMLCINCGKASHL
jgi:hypothetical protein